MMQITLQGHEDQYAVEQLAMALFGVDSQAQVVSSLHRGNIWLSAVTTVTVAGKESRAVRKIKAERETVRLRRQMLQQSLYLAALAHLENPPAWGALAGVRPTKITTRYLLEGKTPKQAHKLLQDVYFVTPERSNLALNCSQASVIAEEKLEKDDVCLYVGIPFCPTRCAYCSFVSRSVGKNTQLLTPYLQALEQEMQLTGQLLRQTGRFVRCIYIGGGTPTTLSAEQLSWLLACIRENFDLSRCLEFTVEGGRPDTLNEEKLKAIFAGGADRVSINPQSMQDTVLKASGRPHTAGDVKNSFSQAVKAGFVDINMDLIAGLPTDTVEGFCRSLDEVAALKPSNITVHTLALKKGADLFEKKANLPEAKQVAEMVAYANRTLQDLGYKPYYLYRQKYMSGSFENVGWSLPGRDCLYNIYMMEELCTVLSVGGGGMNKVCLPDGKLVRFHNPKFPEEYISQLESVLKQKEEIFTLL